jgi:hypothetical protein
MSAIYSADALSVLELVVCWQTARSARLLLRAALSTFRAVSGGSQVGSSLVIG